MKDKSILGVKVNKITESESLELVAEWLKTEQKHYITTPNIEFVMAAQHDHQFKKVLNESDLAIPDSARFGWAISELEEKNLLLKLIKWPLFFLPKMAADFPVVTGTDFMEKLIKEASEKGWTVGFLGGRDGVAEKLKMKLEKRFLDLKVNYAEAGGVVDEDGEVLWREDNLINESRLMINEKDNTIQPGQKIINHQSFIINLPTDLLFVAFGHGKQEKWIAKNLEQQPVKIMMGVGGAFDYLSGDVRRAPKSWQKSGFEWLYRLLHQPWRAKRFLSLIKFTFLILISK